MDQKGPNMAKRDKMGPLKLERIMKIHDSRDETQRVVTLTYSNVKQNKDGKWIGTRMTVDRSINDIIPVDDALSESMLNCSILKDNTDTGNNETGTGNNETGTGNDETGTGNDESGTGNNKTDTGNDETDVGYDESGTGNDESETGIEETNNISKEWTSGKDDADDVENKKPQEK